MTILFSAALLVLAAAVVLLFAMFGEMSARVGQSTQPRPDPQLRALDDTHIGSAPTSWPVADLGPLPATGDARLLLALSASCQSCSAVLRRLSEGSRTWSRVDDLIGVAVSAASRQRAEQFLADNGGVPGIRTYVDDGGEWLITEFGVQTSPSVLVFRDGRLDGAYLFNDLESIHELVETKEDVA